MTDKITTALNSFKDDCEVCKTVNECSGRNCRTYMAIEALEYREPKKPIPNGPLCSGCPTCGDLARVSWKFCPNCGQAIDWSDEE